MTVPWPVDTTNPRRQRRDRATRALSNCEWRSVAPPNFGLWLRSCCNSARPSDHWYADAHKMSATLPETADNTAGRVAQGSKIHREYLPSRISHHSCNKQEAVEKCWAHSSLRAAARRLFYIAIHQVSLLSNAATVARRLRIDVHNNINNDNNDNAWQRGPLWPHRMGPIKKMMMMMSPRCADFAGYQQPFRVAATKLPL